MTRDYRNRENLEQKSKYFYQIKDSRTGVIGVVSFWSNDDIGYPFLVDVQDGFHLATCFRIIKKKNVGAICSFTGAEDEEVLNQKLRAMVERRDTIGVSKCFVRINNSSYKYGRYPYSCAVVCDHNNIYKNPKTIIKYVRKSIWSLDKESLSKINEEYDILVAIKLRMD